MDEGPLERRVDARAVRFERVAISVLLLGGFVFKVLWVIPGLAVVLALAVGLGNRANVFTQVFKALTDGRIRAATATEPAATVRFSELFAVAALTVATLLFAISLNPLAWLVTLLEAGVCALHASTGVSVEAAIRDRLRGRRA